MTSMIGATIRRMLTARPSRETVHFHLHTDGQPFVCDRAPCDSPGLTLDEVSR